MNRDERIEEMFNAVQVAADTSPPGHSLNAAFRVLIGHIVDLESPPDPFEPEAPDPLLKVDVFFARADDSKYYGRIEFDTCGNKHRVLFFKDKGPQHYIDFMPGIIELTPSEISDAAKHLGWLK